MKRIILTGLSLFVLAAVVMPPSLAAEEEGTGDKAIASSITSPLSETSIKAAGEGTGNKEVGNGTGNKENNTGTGKRTGNSLSHKETGTGSGNKTASSHPSQS
ncbi:MAG: hypothetical protein F6J97_18740 [Leptolyngbya sp. SIO4C1]|nr:hypothetical protein [Leptolyngbya sp. SIO4C1]